MGRGKGQDQEMKLVWLRSAYSDLKRLQEFVLEHNPHAARNLAIKIKGSVSYLIDHPELGKPATDLPEFRDLSIPFGAGGYILRYRLHEDMIYVVSIRHYRENDFH